MLRRILMAVALIATFPLYADSWALPKPETVHSADERWRLVLTPKQLKGQLEYFSDKVADKPDAGAAEGVPANEPRGELFHKDSGGTWQRVARWTLVNEVAPVSALVASDGTVVTFDNWHAVGYGDEVVVLYRPDGTLVRKLGLADFLEEEDIGLLSRSVNSIWWSGTHRLDEVARQLILEIKTPRPEFVPLSLDTGTMLAPKRILFPKLLVTWTAQDVDTCDGGVSLTAMELAARAVSAKPPNYPPIARNARVSGTVIVDLRIDRYGAVEHAQVVKPLPFGLDKAAHDAIVKWRFRPVEGESASRCGRVTFKYDLAAMSGAR